MKINKCCSTTLIIWNNSLRDQRKMQSEWFNVTDWNKMYEFKFMVIFFFNHVPSEHSHLCSPQLPFIFNIYKLWITMTVLGKDNTIVTHCLLHNFEFIVVLLDWLLDKARKPNLSPIFVFFCLELGGEDINPFFLWALRGKECNCLDWNLNSASWLYFLCQ